MLESRDCYGYYGSAGGYTGENVPNGSFVCNDISDVAGWFGTTVDRLEHDMYKFTDCGAWISWNDKSVTIGSIVEGSDAEFAKEFEFPVKANDLDEWLEELEELTDEAWREANGDYDNCDYEVGYDPYLGCYTDDV